MVDIFRLTVFVLALLVVAAVAALLQPAWARDLSLEGWTVENWLGAEQQRGTALDAGVRAEQHQLAARNRAAQRLFDGQATLFETAALFHRLDREAGRSAYRSKSHGYSDEERACRQVIDWVGTSRREGCGNRARRLEEELRRHKEQHGMVILPDVGTATGTGAESPATGVVRAF